MAVSRKTSKGESTTQAGLDKSSITSKTNLQTEAKESTRSGTESTTQAGQE